MALSFKFTVVKNGTDGKQVIITDTTGNYNANNTGGWGSPNATKASIATADLTITDTDGVEGTPIDLYASPYTFPKTNDLAYLIFSTALTDGVYKYVIDLTFSGYDETSTTVYYLSTWNIDCCMSKFANKVQGCCGNCKNILDKWEEMVSLYEAIQYQFGCENYTECTNLLAKLTKICSGTNCGC